MKKVIIIVVVLCLGGIGGFYAYNSQLTKSREEGKNIVSRAVKVTPKTETNTENKTSETKNNVSTEVKTVEMAETILKKGTFVTLDPAHYASGEVSIVDTNNAIQVRFADNFKTNPDGPDLYVWLVKKQTIKNVAVAGVSSKPGDYIDLGKLTSVTGAQAYEISKAEYDANDYAVVIWCRAFNIQFSNAVLQ